MGEHVDIASSSTGISLADPYVAGSEEELVRLTQNHYCSACSKQGQWITGDKGPLRKTGGLEYHRVAAKCQCGYMNFFYVVHEPAQKRAKVVTILTQMALAGEIPPPELEHTMNQSRAFAHMEDWQGALEACQRAVQIDDSSAGAWYNLGWIYATLGRFGDARDAYLKVIDLPDDFPSALKNLGVAYHALGETQIALDAIDKFLERFPKDRSALELKKDYASALGGINAPSGAPDDART